MICWWFGCTPNYDGNAYGEDPVCERCGEFVAYHDLVGDTRHARVCRCLSDWWWAIRCLFAKPKCPDCGSRDGCNCPPF